MCTCWCTTDICLAKWSPRALKFLVHSCLEYFGIIMSPECKGWCECNGPAVYHNVTPRIKSHQWSFSENTNTHPQNEISTMGCSNRTLTCLTLPGDLGGHDCLFRLGLQSHPAQAHIVCQYPTDLHLIQVQLCSGYTWVCMCLNAEILSDELINSGKWHVHWKMYQ